MKKYWQSPGYCVVALVLLLVAGVSFGAVPSHFSYTKYLLCDPSNPDGGICDFSVKLLGSIFGTVGASSTSPSALPGNGMVAMGYMFRIFNIGICGIIGLLTALAVFSHGLRAAQDGMQQGNQKAIFALMRITMGISLVLPTATGYSLMQRLVMQTVVYGSGFANNIYQTVLTGAGDGAILLFRKSASNTSTSGSSADTLAESDIKTILSADQQNFLKGAFLGRLCNSVSNSYMSQLSGFRAYGHGLIASFPANVSQCHADQQCVIEHNAVYAAACTAKAAVCNQPVSGTATQQMLTQWFDNDYMTAFAGSRSSDPTSSLPQSYDVSDSLEGNSTLSFAGFSVTSSAADNNNVNNNQCGSVTVPVMTSTDNGSGTAPDLKKYMYGPIRFSAESMGNITDNFVYQATKANLRNTKFYNQLLLMKTRPGPTDLLGVAPETDTSVRGTVTSSLTGLSYNAVEYTQLLVPILRSYEYQSKGNIASSLSSFVKEAKSVGWISAGRYYFNLIRLNNYLQNIQNVNLSTQAGKLKVPTYTAGTAISLNQPFITLWKQVTKQSGSSLSASDLFNEKTISDMLAWLSAKDPNAGPEQSNNSDGDHFNSGADGMGNAFKDGFPDAASDFGGSIGHGIADAFQGNGGGNLKKAGEDLYHSEFAKSIRSNASTAFNSLFRDNTSLSGQYSSSAMKLYATSGIGALMIIPMVNAMKDILGYFDHVPEGMLNDPIVFIHGLGMKILGSVLHGLMLTNGVIFGVTIAANICGAQQPLGAATNSSVGWVGGMVQTMVAPLLMAGGVCAYYVPLYPFLVFTMGVIGWLVSVIDAMIAMPLVCLGLTAPEGHDFLGKAEQATMLLLSVFIRPAVMIFALIAAIALSYVGLRMVNIGFMGIMVDGFGTGMQLIPQGMDIKNLHTASLASQMTGGSVFSSFGISGSGASQAVKGANSVSGGITGIKDAVMVAVNGGVKYGGGSAQAYLPMFAIPCLLIMYTMMVYTIVTQCFGMMDKIVKGVLMWIGGPQGNDNSLQALQEIQGGMTSAGNTMGQMVGQSSKGAEAGGKMAHAVGKNTRLATQYAVRKPLGMAFSGAKKGLGYLFGSSNEQGPKPPPKPPASGGDA